MLQRPGGNRATGPRSPGPILDTGELIDRFLRSRIALTPATIRNYRWALIRLADIHTSLPLDMSVLTALMESEARYLNGSSQQVRWDILRVFYSWARKQNRSIPALPYVFWGRRHRGEKRGRKRTIR